MSQVVIYSDPPVSHLYHVASNLRFLDQVEIEATRHDASPMTITRELAECPLLVSATVDKVPAAVFGAFPCWPGVWEVFLLTTFDFPRAVMAFSRFCRQDILPALYESGAHRAQVHILSEYKEARRLVEILGAKSETPSGLRQFGRNGEDFHLYVWNRDSDKVKQWASSHQKTPPKKPLSAHAKPS